MFVIELNDFIITDVPKKKKRENYLGCRLQKTDAINIIIPSKPNPQCNSFYNIVLVPQPEFDQPSWRYLADNSANTLIW